MQGKRINILVNIFLGIIVIVYIFGTIWIGIKFNREHNSLESMGYNEELIKKITNEQ